MKRHIKRKHGGGVAIKRHSRGNLEALANQQNDERVCVHGER